MKVQLGTGGTASSAATLADLEFQPCAEGAFKLDQSLLSGQSTEAFRRFIIDGEHTVNKTGDVRVLVRVKCRCPLASYNVSGVVVTNVPEFQIHTVLTLPKVVVAALMGTLSTTPDSGEELGVTPAQTMAQASVAEAIAILATILTNQPANFTSVNSGLMNSPFFKGVMGVCPMNYATADFGSVRVLPPPQRS